MGGVSLTKTGRRKTMQDRSESSESWTPEVVEARLIEAVRYVQRVGGRAGPAGYISLMPEFRPTLEDFLAEGWPLPDDDEEAGETAMMLQLPAHAVSQRLAALVWVADLLAPSHLGYARAVNAWIMARVYNLPFKVVLRDRKIGRQVAYTHRDRGLALLSVRLDRAGVPVWRSMD